MLQRALRSRPGRIVLVLLVLTGLWETWLTSQAAHKLPSDLTAHASDRGTVDLRVTLRFPPERFHILTFQRLGRVSGSEGNSVELRSVPVTRVWQIARFYWVRQITVLPPGQE